MTLVPARVYDLGDGKVKIEYPGHTVFIDSSGPDSLVLRLHLGSVEVPEREGRVDGEAHTAREHG